jgi:hypothetical protein
LKDIHHRGNQTGLNAGNEGRIVRHFLKYNNSSALMMNGISPDKENSQWIKRKPAAKNQRLVEWRH